MVEITNLSPPSSPDDHQLLQKLLARDSAAWAQLQQQLMDWLYTYLRSRLYWMADAHLRECAQECTQAASERILRRLHLYRGEGALLGWCRVVALHVAIDWIRRDRLARLLAPAHLHEESGPSDNPIPAIERDLELEKIQASIDEFVATKLSAREQIVLGDAETETDALAARLGVATNNLYQIRHRALGKIRRHLEQQGYTRQRLIEWGIL